MEMNSIHSNYSDQTIMDPVTSDGAITKDLPEYLRCFEDIKPYKFDNLSGLQKESLKHFSCGNDGIDTFLSHGDGLKFNIDRNKMGSMVMATSDKVLGYMAYSIKEVNFYIPKYCSHELKEITGFSESDKVIVLHYLGIDEAAKRKGLGSSMVMKLYEQAKAQAKRDPSIRLLILHSTAEAYQFYEDLGFHKIGKLDTGLIEYAYSLAE